MARKTTIIPWAITAISLVTAVAVAVRARITIAPAPPVPTAAIAPPAPCAPAAVFTEPRRRAIYLADCDLYMSVFLKEGFADLLGPGGAMRPATEPGVAARRNQLSIRVNTERMKYLNNAGITPAAYDAIIAEGQRKNWPNGTER